MAKPIYAGQIGESSIQSADGESDNDEEIGYYPLFQHKYAGVGFDMLEDWVATLMRQNKTRIRETLQCSGVTLQNRTVEFVFILCQKLGMAPGVKFSALALFDAFMIRHICWLYDQHHKQKGAKKKDWETIEAKVSGQVILRLFSCIQIASKMENQTNTVKLEDFNRMLRDMGHSCTKEHVLKSELRVLKTLDFRINMHSPLVYVETILKLLQMQYPELPIDEWYPTCLEVLEAVYLDRDALYGALLQGIVGKESFRLQLAKLQNDYMFLACAAILTAVFLDGEQKDATWMAWTLNTLTGQSFHDMTMFCGAVAERINNVSPDNRIELSSDEDDEQEGSNLTTEAEEVFAAALAAPKPPSQRRYDDEPSTSYAQPAMFFSPPKKKCYYGPRT